MPTNEARDGLLKISSTIFVMSKSTYRFIRVSQEILFFVAFSRPSVNFHCCFFFSMLSKFKYCINFNIFLALICTYLTN